MMAVVMVVLLSCLWIADKLVDRGSGLKLPSAWSRGFRPRGTPKTDP